MNSKDRGGGERVIVEAFLSYWLSRYILLRETKDVISAYMFILPIRLTKGKKLPLGPLHLGLLSARLDECAENITCVVRHYDVVTYADISFLQIFF